MVVPTLNTRRVVYIRGASRQNGGKGINPTLGILGVQDCTGDQRNPGQIVLLELRGYASLFLLGFRAGNSHPLCLFGLGLALTLFPEPRRTSRVVTPLGTSVLRRPLSHLGP